MVSKTRRRQIKRCNQENSFDQLNETPNVASNRRTSSQNSEQARVTLSNVEVETMIRNAVEKEILKYGIDRNQNNSRSEVVQMSSSANNQLNDYNGPSSVHSNRAAHFIFNNGNNGKNWSREYNCPDPAALATQIYPGPDMANCHNNIVKYTSNS